MNKNRIDRVETISLVDLMRECNFAIENPLSDQETRDKYNRLKKGIDGVGVFSRAKIEHYAEGGARIVVKEIPVNRKKILGLF